MESSRNVVEGLPTAPELVLDLLIAHGAALPAAALCRAGALFNLDAAVVRVALTRLVVQGKVARVERGCYAIAWGCHALTAVVDGWWQRQQTPRAWSGAWVAVIDGDVQRQDKTVWRRHRLALQLRGFASLAPGLWLRPDNLRGGVAQARIDLARLGLADQALVVRLDGLDGDARQRAHGLWEVLRLPEAYRAMAEALRASAERLPTLALGDATRESLLLGRGVIAALLRDPLLPAALMDPAPRQDVARQMRRYQRQARAVCRAFLAAAP